MNSRLIWLSLALGACVVGGLATATDSSAQVTGRPQVQAAAKLRPVTISTALRQVLQSKRTFNAATLQPALSYAANRPTLQLKNGARVVLEPIDPEPNPPAQLVTQASQLPVSLQKYSGFIRRDWIVTGPVVTGPPASVDHSSRQTAIRDQGGRGTCTAFASMAGLESFYKWKNNTTKDLSENHTYHVFMQARGSTCPADPGIQTWQGAGFLTSNRVCAEPNMPYSGSVPSPDTNHVPAGCTGNSKWGFVGTQVLFGTNFGGDAYINANNTNYLESVLSDGNDIVYGTYVAGNDWHDGTAETGTIDVQVDAGGNPAAAYAGHAMLLVGYDRNAHYFIFKNSWGPGRGHGGYMRLSYNYVQTYGKYGYYITAATAP